MTVTLTVSVTVLVSLTTSPVAGFLSLRVIGSSARRSARASAPTARTARNRRMDAPAEGKWVESEADARSEGAFDGTSLATYLTSAVMAITNGAAGVSSFR